jgi:hypothetical protein
MHPQMCGDLSQPLAAGCEKSTQQSATPQLRTRHLALILTVVCFRLSPLYSLMPQSGSGQLSTLLPSRSRIPDSSAEIMDLPSPKPVSPLKATMRVLSFRVSFLVGYRPYMQVSAPGGGDDWGEQR